MGTPVPISVAPYLDTIWLHIAAEIAYRSVAYIKLKPSLLQTWVSLSLFTLCCITSLVRDLFFIGYHSTLPSMGKADLPGPVGPLISPNYIPEDITKADVAISSTVWALTLVWCGICSWQGFGQTKRARRPWKTVYIWMIWLELLVCFAMGLECWCFIMKWIHPSELQAKRCACFLTNLHRLCLLLYHPVLVVHPSSAPTADHHQPRPCHLVRQKASPGNHDYNCGGRHAH